MPWFCLDVVAALRPPPSPLRRGVGPTLSPCGQVVVTKDYRVLVRGWWVWRSFVWIAVSVRCVGGVLLLDTYGGVGVGYGGSEGE